MAKIHLVAGRDNGLPVVETCLMIRGLCNRRGLDLLKEAFYRFFEKWSIVIMIVTMSAVAGITIYMMYYISHLD